MRNTVLQLQPDAWHALLYYIAASFVLLLLLALPARAEEPAPSADPSTDLTLGTDITDAYNKYGSGLDDSLGDIQNSYDGTVNDSVLEFAKTCTEWIPAEIWVIVGLSLASMVVLGIVRALNT